MPFVSNMPSQDEEQKNPSQGAVPASGGAPVTVTPSSGVLGAGTPTGTPGGGTTASPAGGQFASLNKYLEANQGNAAPIASSVTSGIGKEYTGLDTANKAALTSIANQVSNAPGYVADTSGTLAAEAANPASFASNPANVTSFQNVLKNTYSGPASAESTSDYANQQAAINKAIAQGQSNTQTEAGRENLISQNEKAPSTSTTALNSAILSQDPNALASVENAYKPFQNLLTGLSSGAQDVNKQIAANQQNAAASSKAAQDALTGQISALNKTVAGETGAAQAKAAQANAQLKSDIAAGTPSDADLSAMGISRDQWNSLSDAQKAAATSQNVSSRTGQFNAKTGTANVDLGQFLTQTDPNAVITSANAATPQDYANAKAFQTLLNGMSFAAPSMTLNPTAASQAGTAPTSLNQFDYQTALNTANATKSDEVAQAQAYVDALQSGADEQHAQLAAKQAGRQKEEQTAELLTGVGAPLALASNLPVIGQPISNAVDTVVQAVSGGTWICTAMKEAGYITDQEIDNLHNHLFKAVHERPWAFIRYAILGQSLAKLANVVHTEWWYWKPYFYDNIMTIEKPAEAVDAYEKEFWRLARRVAQRLWWRIWHGD